MSDAVRPVEELAAQFHDIYQQEAKRQGDVRHKDAYTELPENVKEFDRVLARHVIQMILAAEAAAIEDEAQNPWKRVIIEELIVDHTLMKEHVNNPKKALGEIIRWNQKVALDPAVSEDACKLQAQARLEEHKRVCRTCVNSLTSLCARGRELEAQANP